MAVVRPLRRDLGFVDATFERLKGALARVENKVAGRSDPLRNTRRDRISRAKLPPILINTMPKSGSIYLTRAIANSLGIEFSTSPVAHGFFPTYFMMPSTLGLFRLGGVVRQEHFDASPINLVICAQYVDRIVLHVRDPRQATLSWTHHFRRLVDVDPTGVPATMHQPPEEFRGWTFERQPDWHIDHHLVSLVAWLRQWRAAEETARFKILWTRFDELVNDERALFNRILAFHDIPYDRIVLRPPAKTMEYHYRCGRTDEWEAVLTAEQKARSLDIIGRDLLRHYGWSVD